MRRTSYERFALSANPFRDLASDSLERTEVFHVTQEADQDLERTKQDVLDGVGKAFLLLAGPSGIGKTQRLRVTFAQAQAEGAFAFYANLGETDPAPLHLLAEAVLQAAKGKARRQAKADWATVLARLAKGKPVPPETAGRSLAEGLGAIAPAFVLLNDLDHIDGAPRKELLDALLSTASHLPIGVLLVLACQPGHVLPFSRGHPALASRLNRTVLLRGLTDEEARLLLAKRMASKRIVEDIDPLFPFTAGAVAELNGVAGGVPRRVLQLADVVLDGAVKQRAFQVGPETVQSILERHIDEQLVPQAQGTPEPAVDPATGPAASPPNPWPTEETAAVAPARPPAPAGTVKGDLRFARVLGRRRPPA